MMIIHGELWSARYSEILGQGPVGPRCNGGASFLSFISAYIAEVVADDSKARYILLSHYSVTFLLVG